MNIQQINHIIKTYLPNHLPFGRLALVAIRGSSPMPSVIQKISATQIFGGRSWSLAIIRVMPHERVTDPSPKDVTQP